MLLLVLLALAGAPQPADPLTPARTGQSLCYQPDAAARTCASLASYAFAADGSITGDARTALSPSPVVIIQTRTPVRVRDGMECYDTGNLADQIVGVEFNGQALAGDQLQTAGQMIAQQILGVIGSGELCSSYEPAADGSLKAVSRVDGVERPEMEATVRWVNASDGWTVVPPTAP